MKEMVQQYIAIASSTRENSSRRALEFLLDFMSDKGFEEWSLFLANLSIENIELLDVLNLVGIALTINRYNINGKTKILNSLARKLRENPALDFDRIMYLINSR